MLTEGPNTLTLRATDLAGNTTLTNLAIALDLSVDTNPPTLTLYWPQDGGHLSGTNFTLRGILDDPTATVTMSVVDDSGASNSFAVLVERNGLFWAENLPLTSGTNRLILIATDAAGNTLANNLTVIKSLLTFTIDAVPQSNLNSPAISMTGTFADTEHTIWVNGVRASLNG